MWSLVAHQIENVRALATIDKGRPRAASLRRAVSTAYYALFQALCHATADALVGWDKSWDAVTPIFRALDHRSTEQMIMPASIEASRELQIVRDAFKKLREVREWADYNPEPRPKFEPPGNASPFTRSEALTLIETAQVAIESLDRLDDEARLRLAARLVTKTRK